MQYTRKQYPREDGETDRDYVTRVISLTPKGYAPFVRTLDFVKNIEDSAGQTFGEKLFNWLNPSKDISCVQCGQPTQFKQLSHGYYDFCSYTCRAKHNQSYKNGCSEHAKAQRKLAYDTNKESIISKSKATKLERYGMVGNPKAAESAHLLKLQRHGVEAVNALTNVDTMIQYIQIDIMTSEQIGNLLGVSPTVVQTHAKKLDVKFPKINGQSKEEHELYRWVQSLGVDTQARDRSMGIEVDILIPSRKIAIEYNGSYWHSPDNSLSSSTRTTHLKKTQHCAEHGVQLIHIFDSDWKNNRVVVQNRIKNKLGIGSRLYARKLVFREVDLPTAKEFFRNYHIQGSCSASIAYGLFDKDQLVSCMSFGRPRYNKKYQWELLRFCSLEDYTIVGGASRLFAKFVLENHPTSVISYCDLRWGIGQVYSALGMICEGTTPPSYWLVNPKDSAKIKKHRSQFMKHKLVNLGHDPKLTEHEITKSLGLFRVYDCGTSKWVWNSKESIT